MSSFNKGDRIFAQEIKELKSRVKSEMQRRNLTGSLSSYGGTAYDYNKIPVKNAKISTEHYTKIREPISKINTEGLPTENSPNMPSLTILEGKLTQYESYNGKSATTNGCMSSCSGLCFSACTGCSGCSGCTGCGGACSYGCTGCSSSCSGSCSGGCSGTCSGGCSGCAGCGGSCTAKCASNCFNVY